jgi:hypothetical protein
MARSEATEPLRWGCQPWPSRRVDATFCGARILLTADVLGSVDPERSGTVPSEGYQTPGDVMGWNVAYDSETQLSSPIEELRQLMKLCRCEFNPKHNDKVGRRSWGSQ